MIAHGLSKSEYQPFKCEVTSGVRDCTFIIHNAITEMHLQLNIACCIFKQYCKTLFMKVHSIPTETIYMSVASEISDLLSVETIFADTSFNRGHVYICLILTQLYHDTDLIIVYAHHAVV